MAKIKRWGDPPYYRIAREFDLEKMSANATLVMVSLSKHMNDETHECFISYKTLAKETHRGNSSIANALRELREMGFVGKQRRYGNSNIYTLVVPSELALPVSQGRMGQSKIGVKPKRNTQAQKRKPLSLLPQIDPDAPVDDYYG